MLAADIVPTARSTMKDFVADEIEFLTPRDRDGAGYGGAPAPSEPYRGGESQAVAPEGFTDVDDDDLPF